ncbi:MAG: acylneuraminate cytidylyltransferase family protein [Candidatus Vogelbacteria bacterium]|nr:acylneuraminate cytidylyltransferase family protein [Candidatus Vogelbacteria bacterium]
MGKIADKKCIAIIPARGGSKRFPGKNIHSLMGLPLIAHPIRAAQGAARIDRVIVSTDSETIADAARKAGAEIPFMRPASLAQDTSSVIDVAAYTVLLLEKREGYTADYTVLLQPTTPLVTPLQIDAGLLLAFEKDADSVVSVAEVDTINHPFNIRNVAEDGTIAFWQNDLHYEYYSKKQKPKFFHAANMWISSYRTLVDGHRLEGARNYPLIVDPIYSSDIDYEIDLIKIEAYLLYLKTHGMALP